MQARFTVALIAVLSAWAQSQPSRWDAAMDAGKTAYEQGRYADAEKELQAALGEAESFEKHDPRLAATLDQLITVYRTEGKPMLAEPHYHRLLGIEEGTWGPMDPRLVTVLNGLGTLYTANRQWADAESVYQRALAIREKALGGEHPEVAATLENLAALYAVQAKFDNAEAYYLRALGIRERSQGTEAMKRHRDPWLLKRRLPAHCRH